MTLKEIQLELCKRLKDAGWDKLRMFMLGEEFESILKTLYTNTKEGKRFTPVLKDIFRAFLECPYDTLRVVIVGQDPYPQVDVADGIAFSCSKSVKAQPSLRYLLQEVDDTVYAHSQTPVPWNLDLKRWSNQGILMLNTALTCEINNIGSHIELWKPFIVNLLETLNNNNTGIIYVFLGKKAMEWHKLIGPANYKFFTTHPASAAYTGKQKWDSGNLFNQINKVLKNNTNTEIIW